MNPHSLATLLLAAPLLLSACSAPPEDTPDDSASSSNQAASTNPDIAVSQPSVNDVVTSPLTVAGEARGTWYFEASFPVRLFDDQGNEIAVTPAQAQGDWMTEDFVPFEATLEFETDAQVGTLVLENDNPSGLPENAASISIPVQFE